MSEHALILWGAGRVDPRHVDTQQSLGLDALVYVPTLRDALRVAADLGFDQSLVMHLSARVSWGASQALDGEDGTYAEPVGPPSPRLADSLKVAIEHAWSPYALLLDRPGAEEVHEMYESTYWGGGGRLPATDRLSYALASSSLPDYETRLMRSFRR